MKLTEADFLSKLYNKWRKGLLNRQAKDLLKKEPDLEKSLKAINKNKAKIIKMLKANYKPK